MMEFVESVCFFASTLLLVFAEYDVTVMTDPPNGPFLILNEIEFTCVVDPSPPEPVTYTWHALKDASGPTTIPTGNNTTYYTPSYWNLHTNWFFCKAFSNGTLIGVGRKRVEVQGFVFSEAESLVRYFTLGDTIELQVNISTNSLASYIQTLTWYHNGTEIRTSNRITVQNSQLIIYNALSTDAGMYQVKVTSLNVRSHSCCDSTWLYFLRNHAAYAPVTFIVRNFGLSSDQNNVEEPPIQQYYPLVTEDSSTLISIQDNDTWTNSDDYIIEQITTYLQPMLSVNGIRLSANQAKFNLTQSINGPTSLQKEINFLYNASDEGFYIHLLYTDAYVIEFMLRDFFWCRCYDYRSYVLYDLNLNSVSFAILPFILRTYKPPLVNISSSYDTEMDMELLTCTAVEGIPDSHNITLKQKEVSMVGNGFDIYLTGFGEYTCIVESLYDTTTVMLLVQEKAMFQLLFTSETHNSQECLQWKKRENAYLLHKEISDIFKTFCDCVVDVHSVFPDCSTAGNLLVKGIIVNSDSECNISASMLIDMLQVGLLTSTDTITITLGQSLFKLNTQCPPRVNLASSNLCDKLLELMVSPSTQQICSGALIGGSFIGGMVVGSLTCLILLCIGLCVMKLRKGEKMRQTGSNITNTSSASIKDEEVVMATNQAYETVETRYLPASTVERSTRDEPIYETPAT